MSYKRAESVLVVLYNEHNQVLVLQRIDDANFWQSVTGTMEGREAPVETAVREVLEETGIALGAAYKGDSGFLMQLMDCRSVNQYIIRPQWLYRYPPGVTRNFEYVFCAQIPLASAIVLTEHTAYEWLSKKDAIDKVWSNTNKQAIARFVPSAEPNACI